MEHPHLKAHELVTTLRSLRQDPRPWPEIRDEYLAAQQRLHELMPPVTTPLPR
jgi:hypothetical protein